MTTGDLPIGDWQDVSLTPSRTNMVALPFGVIMFFAPLVLYRLLWGTNPLRETARSVPFVWLIGSVTAGIVIHEALHAVGFRVFGAVPWARIRFGIHWRGLMPYANTRAPMTASAYRGAALLPGLLLGVLPAVAGVLGGNAPAAVFGAIFTSTAAGDAIVIWLIRSVPSRRLVVDHPSQIGCLVAREEDQWVSG